MQNEALVVLYNMSEYNHWFHIAKPVKFIFVDYRASIFVIIFFLHMRLYTLVLLIFIFVVLWILEMNKLSLVNAFKRLRTFLAGKTIKRP
jgi:hypothetical protein